MRSLLPFAAVALPAVGLVAAFVGGADHPARLFRADLTAWLLGVALAAFAVRTRRSFVLGLGGSIAVAVAHVTVGGSVSGALILLTLVASCGAAAACLALLAEAARLSSGVAPLAACSVLMAAATILFWADAAATGRPPAERFVFREALIAFDPALACAYGAANYDRMHDADVYRSVSLAAEPHRPPTGLDTSLRWALIALGAGGMAWVLRRYAPASSEGLQREAPYSSVAGS